MMMLLIKISECDDDVTQRIATAADDDRNVKVFLMMMLLIDED